MAEYSTPGGTTRHDERPPEAATNAEGMGEQINEKARGMTDQAQEKAQEYGEKAHEQAEKAREQSASGMERAAELLREKTSESDGMPAEVGAKAAGTLDSASGYLRSHDTGEIWSDIEVYAREHPTHALAGAVVAGFLLGRILR